MISNQAKRFHDFDALRGYAMLLGIVLHGLMSFMVIPFWPAQDRNQNTEVCGTVLNFIHGFRLPLFFLISGFFTAMLWRKRGLKGLLKQRAIRILIPLAVGTIVTWVLVLPLTFWGNAKKAVVAEQRETGQGSDGVLADAEKKEALWQLVRSGDGDQVRASVAEGADVNAKDSGFQLSPLAWAVIEGKPELVSLLIKAGANVDARDGEGSSALHAASFLGRGEEGALLIAAGANVNARNSDGETPLDSQRHGMDTVNWVSGMLGIEIKRVELKLGRKQIKELLVENGGKSGILNPVLQQLLDLWKLGAQLPVFQHLWFLYYLCWLVVMFATVVLVRKLIPFHIPKWMSASPRSWLWVLSATVLCQLFMREGVGADTAPGILLWPPKLLYYAVFFAVGALSYGNESFETNAGRFWIFWALLGVPAFVVASIWLGSGGERFGWQHWAGSLSAAVFTWLMIYAHLGFFRRFFSGESRWVRYLSDSAYWLYLAHLPVVTGLQIWISDLDWPIIVKFTIVFMVTTGFLLVVYELLVRYTFIGAVLNGRKKRPV